MKRSDFDYTLPPELIAQRPLPERSASRLMTLDGNTGAVAHRSFPDLTRLLRPEDLLVFNNTRVIPARLFGRKDSGGRVEIMIERLTSDSAAVAHVRASRSPKAGAQIRLDTRDGGTSSEFSLRITGRQNDLFTVESATAHSLAGILQAVGHMPLPHYIRREDDAADLQRYQTVYASREGAVAAPTAGLHFTEELLAELDAVGVRRAEVTLHVGAGTFQPVRVDEIEEHRMHAEYVEVNEAVCRQVAETRAAGGRVVAVGTTAVRSLETAAATDAGLQPFTGDTAIFIYPGYRFRVVDAMLTNFHLPESTLLMLVSAFAGHANVMSAYRQAMAQRYRFFSYGDAMFVTAGGESR